MNWTLRTALAVLVLIPNTAGCIDPGSETFSSPAKHMPEPDHWSESGTFICHDFDLLWEVAKGQATKNGHRIDDDGTSFMRKRVVTVWKTELATTRMDGKRRRRYVEFESVKDAKDAWKVRTATVKQKNMDIEDPLNAANAKWRKDEPDVEDAERVAYLIEAQFHDEYGPSKELQYR